MSDTLRELAKPFQERFIKKPPSGKFGTYVSHDVVTQKLLATTGPFDMELVQEIRGTANEIVTEKRTYPAVENALVGIWLKCTFHVDGRTVSITEAGDVESPAMKDTDGERAKDAISDAIKRCAMRLGVGLHLWAGEDFVLYDALSKSSNPKGGEVSAEARPSQPSNTQAGGEVSADVSGAGTDNEGDPGELGEVPFAEAGKTPAPAPGKKSGSEPLSEPKGAGESSSPNEEASPSAPAPSPIPPAADLVAAYGTKDVLMTARRIAKETAQEQPLSTDDINEPLAILTGKELAKAKVS